VRDGAGDRERKPDKAQAERNRRAATFLRMSSEFVMRRHPGVEIKIPNDDDDGDRRNRRRKAGNPTSVSNIVAPLLVRRFGKPIEFGEPAGSPSICLSGHHVRAVGRRFVGVLVSLDEHASHSDGHCRTRQHRDEFALAAGGRALPAGCCTEWVASKITGAPVVRARDRQAASGGEREFVPVLARAAVAVEWLACSSRLTKTPTKRRPTARTWCRSSKWKGCSAGSRIR